MPKLLNIHIHAPTSHSTKQKRENPSGTRYAKAGNVGTPRREYETIQENIAREAGSPYII